MQHGTNKRTLGRSRDGRTALMRGLCLELFKHDRIVTTTAKAKELRPFAERLITTAKKDTVAARRTVASSLGEPNATLLKKLFTDIAPKYQERSGGYTRIIKMSREGGKDEAVIELV